MNKLNQLGMSAIEFRKEFWNKNYPELVHDSIGFAIDKNFEDCPAVLEKIKDYACSDREFEKFLLAQASCVKSYEELLAEFDALKDATLLTNSSLLQSITSFQELSPTIFATIC